MTNYTYAATPSHNTHKATALAWAQQTEIGNARFDEQVPAKDLAKQHKVSLGTMYNILYSERVIRDAQAAKIAQLNKQAERLHEARNEALKGWSDTFGEMDEREQAVLKKLNAARAEIFCLQGAVADLTASKWHGRVAGILASLTIAVASVAGTLAFAGSL